MKISALKFIKLSIPALILPAVLYFAGCATVPLTGRKQMTLISQSSISSMGTDSYREVMEQVKLSQDTLKTDMIRRTGRRIAASAEEFLTERGQASDLKYYDWEFNLIDDDKTINAWAMPGGKIAFYTGILKIAQTEDEVAVIMGHEIAHVIARHGNERMSQLLLVQFGSIALDKLLESNPEQTRNFFMTAFGLGAQIGVLLPYSRKHEYEADEIGLHLMHMAGYNPRSAVDFWTKMTKLDQTAPPEFLSTHPPSIKRVNRMLEIIPKLKK